MCFEILDCPSGWEVFVLQLYFPCFVLYSFFFPPWQLCNDFSLNSQGLLSRISLLLFDQGHPSSHRATGSLRGAARNPGWGTVGVPDCSAMSDSLASAAVGYSIFQTPFTRGRIPSLLLISGRIPAMGPFMEDMFWSLWPHRSGTCGHLCMDLDQNPGTL